MKLKFVVCIDEDDFTDKEIADDEEFVECVLLNESLLLIELDLCLCFALLFFN